MVKHTLRSFCLFLLLLPGLVEALPAARAQASGAASVDLKSEIDKSIRWLRARQAPDGSYGGGVEGTAWTQPARVRSPRHTGSPR